MGSLSEQEGPEGKPERSEGQLASSHNQPGNLKASLKGLLASWRGEEANHCGSRPARRV